MSRTPGCSKSLACTVLDAAKKTGHENNTMTLCIKKKKVPYYESPKPPQNIKLYDGDIDADPGLACTTAGLSNERKITELQAGPGNRSLTVGECFRLHSSSTSELDRLIIETVVVLVVLVVVVLALLVTRYRTTSWLYTHTQTYIYILHTKYPYFKHTIFPFTHLVTTVTILASYHTKRPLRSLAGGRRPNITLIG